MKCPIKTELDLTSSDFDKPIIKLYFAREYFSVEFENLSRWVWKLIIGNTSVYACCSRQSVTPEI